MHVGIVAGVEDSQEYEPCGADEGADDGGHGEDLLPLVVVGHKAAGVTQPPLGDEDDVKANDHAGTRGDEDGLPPAGGPDI